MRAYPVSIMMIEPLNPARILTARSRAVSILLFPGVPGVDFGEAEMQLGRLLFRLWTPDFLRPSSTGLNMGSSLVSARQTRPSFAHRSLLLAVHASPESLTACDLATSPSPHPCPHTSQLTHYDG